jgi:hypothetical protein
MSKKQPDPKPAPAPTQPTDALVIFGGRMNMLPKELEELGLAGKIQAQEIPGIAQAWKPVQAGDYLLGRCVQEREVSFPQIDPDGTRHDRIRKVLVFDTAVPGGFRSVWLGADLRIKLSDPIGKVYQITFQGDVNVGRNAKLNAMKSYQVFEIQPTEIPG